MAWFWLGFDLGDHGRSVIFQKNPQKVLRPHTREKKPKPPKSRAYNFPHKVYNDLHFEQKTCIFAHIFALFLAGFGGPSLYLRKNRGFWSVLKISPLSALTHVPDFSISDNFLVPFKGTKKLSLIEKSGTCVKAERGEKNKCHFTSTFFAQNANRCTLTNKNCTP